MVGSNAGLSLTFWRSTSRCISLFAQSISRTSRGEIRRPPIPGIDDNVTDAAVDIIHEEVLDMAYVAVGGPDMIPGDCYDAAQMRITYGLNIDTNVIARL